MLRGHAPRRSPTAPTIAAAAIGAHAVREEGFGTRATVVRRHEAGEQALGEIALQVPGRHNVLNALAAIERWRWSWALRLRHRPRARRSSAAPSAASSARARRRITVVDDYGHHPTEIAAVLPPRAPRRRSGSSSRSSRIGTRGRAICSTDSARRSRCADEIVLTDIYAAGEDPIPGATIEALTTRVERAAPGRVLVVKALDGRAAQVARIARPGDLVITLGADRSAVRGRGFSRS